MISYLGSLVQFSPATGRVGRCRQISLCGEHLPCSGHTGFAPYRCVYAFPVCTALAPSCSIWSWPCVECGSSFRVLHKSTDSVAPAFCVFPGLSGSGSQRLGPPLPGCGAPIPNSVAPARAAKSGLRKSLDRNRGPVCSVGGGGFSGAEFSPFPSPLPPTSSWDGPALLWSFSVPLFCEPPAVCSGRLIFLAIPQFKKAPSDCSQSLQTGPYPKQCCPLLSVSPPLAGGRCRRLEYFSAESCF